MASDAAAAPVPPEIPMPVSICQATAVHEMPATARTAYSRARSSRLPRMPSAGSVSTRAGSAAPAGSSPGSSSAAQSSSIMCARLLRPARTLPSCARKRSPNASAVSGRSCGMGESAATSAASESSGMLGMSSLG